RVQSDYELLVLVSASKTIAGERHFWTIYSVLFVKIAPTPRLSRVFPFSTIPFTIRLVVMSPMLRKPRENGRLKLAVTSGLGWLLRSRPTTLAGRWLVPE